MTARRPAVLFTGFPGFLASELLPRVLTRMPAHDAVCVVQPRFVELARRRAMEVETAFPAVAHRIRLVEGDITRAGLGVDLDAAARGAITELYHLAAVYDLSVGRERALRVNVDGTRHVLDVAAGCGALERLHHVSTCYVSGRHPGVFREDDLHGAGAFNNEYERSKHLAEVEVRARMAAGLPATIYRPAIVVGDSRTGATQKFDGPYFVIRWMLRQPAWGAIVPVVGDPRATVLNVVPRDFVVDAIAHLAAHPASPGRTYQLADPAPLTVDALLEGIARATGQRVLRLPLPAGVAKGLIDRVPGVDRLLRIPSSAVDYFTHPTRYDTAHTTADLAGSGIACPRFGDYVRPLVRFARANPQIGSQAMS